MREYRVEARSSGTFGRVLGSCRNHHFVADGPVENGCPGEAITPGELFLAGIATCGVELLEVIARQQGLPLRAARVGIHGVIDREHPVCSDVTVFTSVRLDFHLEGVAGEDAAALVEAFKGR